VARAADRTAPPVTGRNGRRRPSTAAVGLVLLAVTATALAFAIATIAVAVRSGGEDDRAVGVRMYALVQPGQSQAEVRSLLGPPARVAVVVQRGRSRDCWIYHRTPPAAGEFRFCFTGGVLSTKSAR
jgi:hypothetical protein